jgi:hypothetical protein
MTDEIKVWATTNPYDDCMNCGKTINIRKFKLSNFEARLCERCFEKLKIAWGTKSCDVQHKSTDQLLWEKFFPEDCWHEFPPYMDIEHGTSLPCKKCRVKTTNVGEVWGLHPSPTTNAADYLRLMERIKCRHEEEWNEFLHWLGDYDLLTFRFLKPYKIINALLDPARGCAALVEYFCKEER